MVCLKLRCKYSVYFLNYQRKKQKNAEILNITLHVYAEILNSKTYKYAEILSIFVKARRRQTPCNSVPFSYFGGTKFFKKGLWGAPRGHPRGTLLGLQCPLQHTYNQCVRSNRGTGGTLFFCFHAECIGHTESTESTEITESLERFR